MFYTSLLKKPSIRNYSDRYVVVVVVVVVVVIVVVVVAVVAAVTVVRSSRKIGITV